MGRDLRRGLLVAVIMIAAVALFAARTDPAPVAAPAGRAPAFGGTSPRHAGDPGSEAVLAPGVRFRVIRLRAPSQRIEVIYVAAWARVRAELVSAGFGGAPFATVSSSVRRLHALAGVNGYFTTPMAQSPMLVRGGRIVAPSCGVVLCGRNPRTGFGLTVGGSTLLVTVDGRRPGATGMGLRRFATLMRSLGAVWAVNLDGGASSTMVVRGVVANTPSDRAGERPVRTALVLLPSAQGGVSSALRRLRELDRRILLPSASLGQRSSRGG